MDDRSARQLVDDYVKGWENGDAIQILKPLAEDCLIIESHGPTYHGVEQVKQWINEWHQTGIVDKWQIASFFSSNDAAFFEWSFTYRIGGKADSIDGASIVRFKQNKITLIHEYRMTESAFDYFESSIKA